MKMARPANPISACGRALPLAAAFLLCIVSELTAQEASPHPAVAAEIRALLQERPASIAGELVQWDDLQRVYEALGGAAVWLSAAEGEPPGRDIERRLATAPDRGIDAGDLHLAALSQTPDAGQPQAAALRDLLLTDAVLRYARKLRAGSVPDAAFGADWHIEPDILTIADDLVQVVRERTVAGWLDSLEPASASYRRLVEALARYRSIAARGGWPMLEHTDNLKVEGSDPRLQVLRERLRLEGDLAMDEDSKAVLADALRRFQARHGLEPDSKIGAGTRAALAATADQRVAQIAANLERWRHLPRRTDQTYVEVNVAAATLALFEDNAPVMTMRVIVGDVKHPTPVVAANITAVTLNPYWNVPWSISTKEILPRLRREPGYLAKNAIAIVGRPDDPYGQSVDWRAISASSFPYRLQQRPGAQNSLGRIKLEMPNPQDVYLHDTPTRKLFQRSQRTFSHGCIRLEQAAALAVRLLRSPEWDQDAIGRVVAGGQNQRVTIERPVPVYLLYWTAFVSDDGQVQFRPDHYGRDAPIARALGLDQPKAPAVAEASASKG